MLLRGVEFIENLIEHGPFEAKMVFNEHGVLFFSGKLQHRDQKAERISYEDDYKGNALAAMLRPGRIEIRYHRDFPDARVGRTLASLMAMNELRCISNWQANYQGRSIKVR